MYIIAYAVIVPKTQLQISIQLIHDDILFVPRQFICVINKTHT